MAEPTDLFISLHKVTKFVVSLLTVKGSGFAGHSIFVGRHEFARETNNRTDQFC
jgi:hypothetical protein